MGRILPLLSFATLSFLLLPPLVVAIVSFNEFALVIPPDGFTVRWYGNAFRRQDFAQGTVMSLIVGGLATAISIVAGIFGALAVVRYDFRGKELLKAISLSPILVPGVVTGVGILLLARLTGALPSAFFQLLLAHTAVTIPFVLRVLIGSLYGFNRAIEEAARSLGAKPFQVFWKITLPVIKPGVVAAGAFGFAVSFDEVAASTFLVDADTLTLPVALFAYIRINLDPTVAAASTILVLGTLGFILLIEKFVGLEKFTGLGLGT